MRRMILLVALGLCLFAQPANASLLSIDFTGKITQADRDIALGDQFWGSLTLVSDHFVTLAGPPKNVASYTLALSPTIQISGVFDFLSGSGQTLRFFDLEGHPATGVQLLLTLAPHLFADEATLVTLTAADIIGGSFSTGGIPTAAGSITSVTEQVPEPSSLLLVGIAFGGLAAARKRGISTPPASA